MEELKNRILKDGKAKADGGIVLVNGFLNHQLDPVLMMHCAEEFARIFKDKGINKIVTIEASGIAPAILTGYLMNLPVVFIKKKLSSTMGETWSSCAHHDDVAVEVIYKSQGTHDLVHCNLHGN